METMNVPAIHGAAAITPANTAAPKPRSLIQRMVQALTAGAQVVASSSFWGGVREAFSGAWQKNIVVDAPQNLLAFSAVYACVTLICDDISKLRIMLEEQNDDTTWTEVIRKSPFLKLLRKPNRYQTRIQFLQQWVSSKLLHGNTYVLKDRESARGMVSALYVLNPFAVTTLIAVDGSVWYRIARNQLAGVEDSITVPASEIIHDRCTCLWHPLVGVSPIYACGATATQGIRIQNNSAKFFENMSRPSGQLTAPGTIDEVTANRLKQEFETNFSGGNIGRLLVGGDGLKYEPMSMPPQEAQMIEQLQWTVADVARAFRVPMYKLGGQLPVGSTTAQLNQDYYTQVLQSPIEAIEILLGEGLEIPETESRMYRVSLDVEGLLRMDPLARAEAYSKMISSAVMAPNEARLKENLKPVKGGNTPYLQQQNYSLAALDARDSAGPAPGASSSAPPAAPLEGKDFFEGVFSEVDIEQTFIPLLNGAR
jgi:HK97 family phage portal protein